MFKLKPKNNKLFEQLKLIETPEYQYVLTTDKNLTEDDKVNIVFEPSKVHEVNEMLDLITHGRDVILTCHNERGTTRIESRKILYIESFGDDIFIETKTSRFQTNDKLYQLEELLVDKNFIRISKSHIVNIGAIKYIKPSVNSVMKLDLINHEELEVKRTYLKAFKEALSL